MDDPRLGKNARAVLGDAENEAFLSDVSVLEMALKISAGKLELGTPLPRLLETEFRDNSYSALPVRRDHMLRLADLDASHKDPFDRLLIAQAITEDLTILTRDSAFTAYPVKTIW